MEAEQEQRGEQWRKLNLLHGSRWKTSCMRPSSFLWFSESRLQQRIPYSNIGLQTQQLQKQRWKCEVNEDLPEWNQE